MKFLNKEHFGFYKEYGRQYETSDMYLAMFFYLLGLSGSARTNIESLYDFEENQVKPEGVKSVWMEQSTAALVRLAYNLYYSEPMVLENDPDPVATAFTYSVADIMSKMHEWLPYTFDAIKYLYK